MKIYCTVQKYIMFMKICMSINRTSYRTNQKYVILINYGKLSYQIRCTNGFEGLSY